MTTSKPTPVTPFFGGFVLETLTVGMYGESRNAIREYIQNGFDSIGLAIDSGIIRAGKGLIQINMAEDKDSLTIRDNGAGLPVSTAANTLASVGASNKDHTSDAGFRGIGRLAGIVFSNRVTFTTKARGESEETTVVFKAAEMREAMKPENGSAISAEDLLRKCVEASVRPAKARGDHFFEVKLEGFDNPPEECREFKLMEDFVSQIAPVPYSEKFPFRAQLDAAAKECDLPIEEVKIEIKDGKKNPVNVAKRYEDKYKIGTVWVTLTECKIHISPDQNWWAWIGKKDESGAYTDPRVSGLRVRMKNIQIDGTELVREIFQSQAPSHIRFQDWYVGEIFVRPSFLIPNARRDHFEETKEWKRMRKDLGVLIKELGRESYSVSNKGQLALEALESKVTEKREEIEDLRQLNFNNVDRTVSFSAGITKLQKLIAKASKEADLPTSAQLQALNAELTDIKTEAFTHISDTSSAVDEERVTQEARDELLNELIALFESELPTTCAVAVRNLLRKQYRLKAGR
jgi:molecular chaperone HtpG